MREKCTRAWNVFFGPNGVDLVLGFVSFVGNRQQANAVDGGVSRAEARNGKARMVPGDINGVGDEKEERKGRRETQNQACARGRAIRGISHGIGHAIRAAGILHRVGIGRKRELRGFAQAGGWLDAATCFL